MNECTAPVLSLTRCEIQSDWRVQFGLLRHFTAFITTTMAAALRLLPRAIPRAAHRLASTVATMTDIASYKGVMGERREFH